MPGRILPCPPEAIIPPGKLAPVLAVRIKKRRQKVLAPVEPHGEIEACQLHRGEDKHATKFTNPFFFREPIIFHLFIGFAYNEASLGFWLVVLEDLEVPVCLKEPLPGKLQIRN